MSYSEEYKQKILSTFIELHGCQTFTARKLGISVRIVRYIIAKMRKEKKYNIPVIDRCWTMQNVKHYPRKNYYV